jgi:hypothetical protein
MDQYQSGGLLLPLSARETAMGDACGILANSSEAGHKIFCEWPIRSPAAFRNTFDPPLGGLLPVFWLN